MNCLTADRIYAFLEESLSKKEKSETQKHLRQCSACRSAMEERRLISEASESLPVWELPEEFTQETMTAIFPERESRISGLSPAAFGAVSLLALIFGYMFLSGRNLLDFLLAVNHSLIDGIRALSLTTARLIKFAAVFIKAVREFVSYGLKILFRLNSLIGPEIQIGLILLTIAASLSIFWVMKKRILSGEQT